MTTKELRARAGVTSLLSKHNSNPKVAKAEEKLGIYSAVLHLAPHKMSGFNVCKGASPGCIKSCLHNAGNPIFQTGKDRSRIARTQFFFKYRELFLERLRIEIAAHVKRAKKEGLRPAVRLNGTSDLPWERIKNEKGLNIVEQFPEVQFYDYTAVISRLRAGPPENYHLTFSLKENNLENAKEAVELGFNLAVVFIDQLPKTYLGLPVINGDDHDYRPGDPSGSIVGLKAKGVAGKTDTTGFVNLTEEAALPLAA